LNAVVPARGNNGHPGEWVSSKVTNIQKVGQIQGDVDTNRPDFSVKDTPYHPIETQTKLGGRRKADNRAKSSLRDRRQNFVDP
jgi:hypothetical protein